MAQFKSKHAVLTLRSVSMQCNAMQCNAMYGNAMQCNAMQYNAIQCNTVQYNAMQCNVMQVRPSVRNEVSQSFFLFFLFFFGQYVRVRQYVRNTNVGWTDKFQFFFLSGMYRCHGWTDKFQLFQFSFSSVAYSQVSLSVRTEVPTKKKKEKKMTDKHRNTDPVYIQWQKICSWIYLSRFIKRDRWHNSRANMPYY
jgi:hypothetical protein